MQKILYSALLDPMDAEAFRKITPEDALRHACVIEDPETLPFDEWKGKGLEIAYGFSRVFNPEGYPVKKK